MSLIKVEDSENASLSNEIKCSSTASNVIFNPEIRRFRLLGSTTGGQAALKTRSKGVVDRQRALFTPFFGWFGKDI